MGKGKPLLFLPGGLRVITYLLNIEYLSNWYRVFSLDLPGLGKSTIPEKIWSMEDYADFISIYLKKQKLFNIPVIGHSYGGGVGLYLAMNKGLVSKLISFDPMGVASNYSRYKFYFNFLFTKTINDYKAMQTDKKRAFIFNNALSTIYENYNNFPKILKILNYNLYVNIQPEKLKKINIPVKLVWGKYDELFPVTNGKYLHKHISKSELEIVDGNHDWWTLYPEIAGDRAINFLK